MEPPGHLSLSLIRRTDDTPPRTYEQSFQKRQVSRLGRRRSTKIEMPLSLAIGRVQSRLGERDFWRLVKESSSTFIVDLRDLAAGRSDF